MVPFPSFEQYGIALTTPEGSRGIRLPITLPWKRANYTPATTAFPPIHLSLTGTVISTVRIRLFPTSIQPRGDPT